MAKDISFSGVECAHILGALILSGKRHDERDEEMRQHLIDRCLAVADIEPQIAQTIEQRRFDRRGA